MSVSGSAGGHEGGTSGFGGGYGGGGGIGGMLGAGMGVNPGVGGTGGGYFSGGLSGLSSSAWDRAKAGFPGGLAGLAGIERAFERAKARMNAQLAAMRARSLRANPYTTTPVQDFYNSYTGINHPNNPFYDEYRNLRFKREQAVRDLSQLEKDALVSGMHADARAATPIGGLSPEDIADLARKSGLAHSYKSGALRELGITPPESWSALPGQGLLGSVFGDDEDKYGPDEAMRDAKKQGLVDEENKVSQALAYGPMAYPAAKVVGPLVSQAVYGVTEDPYSALGLGMAASKAVGSLAPSGYFSGPMATGLGTVASLAGIPGFSAVNTALGLMDKANTLQAAGVRSPNLDNGFPGVDYSNRGGGQAQPTGLLAAAISGETPVSSALAGGSSNAEIPWHRQFLYQQNPYIWLV